MNDNHITKDEGLQGNENIEEAIAALQKEQTDEMLAHTLTVIRRRMQAKGQLILAVDAPGGDGKLNVQAVKTKDGKYWWAVFTSFEEELKGSGSVMSTFLTDMDQLFRTAVATEGIEGIIINPWSRSLMLNRQLLKIVMGDAA